MGKRKLNLGGRPGDKKARNTCFATRQLASHFAVLRLTGALPSAGCVQHSMSQQASDDENNIYEGLTEPPQPLAASFSHDLFTPEEEAICMKVCIVPASQFMYLPLFLVQKKLISSILPASRS